MSPEFVQVALPRPVEEVFHYNIPDKLSGEVREGSVVVVPFGKRTLIGIVTAMVNSAPVKTREVMAVSDLPPVSPELLELIRWVSGYYMSPVGLLCRLALPPDRGGGGMKFSITESGREAAESADGETGKILDALLKGQRTTHYMEQRFGSEALEETTAAGLIGLVSPGEARPIASEGSGYSRQEKAVTDLTTHQVEALEKLGGPIEKGGFDVSLLKGVTGSGKTEIYIRAAGEALKAGKGVLFLVPEIGLTPLLTSRLEKVAPGRVCLLHSGMTDAERRASWERMVSGSAPLVVGVRSAVFAPIPRLGLIIVDEEHDSSFRQEEAPSYNARDVAVKRAQIQSVPVILGSATPSVESFQNSEQGRYRLLELPERVTPWPEPEMILVDMSAYEERDPENPFLSVKLKEAISSNLAAGEQSMIFLNRRGFSPFILCEDCGEANECPNCSVTLTHHRQKGLLCHYCGHRQAPPETCPSCGSTKIGPVGTGTQKLEEAIAGIYPEAVVERLDRDVITRRGKLEEMLARMDSGEIQILVGTQLLAKGHDFPGVTLAGIISAEQALDLPDFRSPERTYQVITQVAGRAGRGKQAGRVIVQTYTPNHYAVHSALSGDYREFFSQESAIRQTLGYPPFGRLGRIIVEGISEEKVSKAIDRLAARLSRDSDEIRVLGPSPAPLMRIRNRHRWHLMVLAPTPRQLHSVLASARGEPPPGVRVHVRVDPYQLL
jgi:primosomal protein N' (replication factor Y)